MWEPEGEKEAPLFPLANVHLCYHQRWNAAGMLERAMSPKCRSNTAPTSCNYENPAIWSRGGSTLCMLFSQTPMWSERGPQSAVSQAVLRPSHTVLTCSNLHTHICPFHLALHLNSLNTWHSTNVYHHSHSTMSILPCQSRPNLNAPYCLVSIYQMTNRILWMIKLCPVAFQNYLYCYFLFVLFP